MAPALKVPRDVRVTLLQRRTEQRNVLDLAEIVALAASTPRLDLEADRAQCIPVPHDVPMTCVYTIVITLHKCATRRRTVRCKAHSFAESPPKF